MVVLKNCQILNLILSGTASPPLCSEVAWSSESCWWARSFPPPDPSPAKALMYEGAEGRQQGASSRYCFWSPTRGQEGPRNWVWEKENEWKQDQDFGRTKEYKKVDIESKPEVTKMWQVGTPQIPLVSPFYWASFFPSYKHIHKLQHSSYWSQY